MRLLDYLLPSRCLVCNLECSASLCAQCYPEIVDYKLKRCPKCFRLWDLFDDRETCVKCQLKPSLINQRRFLWNYGAVTRDYLNTLKYRPSRKLCQIAAVILANNQNNLFPSVTWNYKLAVPSDRKMLWKRGFNQVELLIKNLDGEDLTSRMQHLGYKTPQSKLNHHERLQNVAHIFKFKERLDGSNILLVDDMVTTGATVEAISAQLVHAGAQEIYLLSLSSKY